MSESVFQIYLFLSAGLMATGLGGILLRRNAIVMLMSIELMLNASNILFVSGGIWHQQTDSQIFVFFVMAIAAAETTVGLALVLLLFRHFRSVEVDAATSLEG